MAKQSMKARENKREKTVAKFKEKKDKLKSDLKAAYKAEAAGDESASALVVELLDKLQAMPRDASASRLVRRCKITGRPHGVYRRFGMCRNMIRIHAMWGDIPGLRKSSW